MFLGYYANHWSMRAALDAEFGDHEICAALAPYLRENGLIFTGIDVIGNYLTEVNVTSPTWSPCVSVRRDTFCPFTVTPLVLSRSSTTYRPSLPRNVSSPSPTVDRVLQKHSHS